MEENTTENFIFYRSFYEATMPLASTQARFIPLAKWNEYHADPSVPALRMLDFKRAENGFEEFNVTERRGSRVLINEQNFFKWQEFYNKK